MAHWRHGLYLIPESMHRSVEQWIVHHRPAPAAMGSFFRAVLLDKLGEAFARADGENGAAMAGWATFIYSYMPSGSWGSEAQRAAWHAGGAEVNRAAERT